MTKQPNGMDVAVCQHVKIVGIEQQCPYLNRDGICGFQRNLDGPNKGKFATLAEVEACPAGWAEKAKGL